MFEGCLVEHGLKFLIAHLVQITKHVEFYLNPVWKPVFQFSVSDFHIFKTWFNLICLVDVDGVFH